MKTPTNLTARIGRWSGTHPWRSIGAWLLLVMVAVFAGRAIGTVKLGQSAAGNGSSGEAAVAASRAFPQAATEQVLIQSSTLTAGMPAFRASVDDVVNRVTETAWVANVQSPYSPGHAGQISRDGHSALVQFDLTGSMSSSAKRVGPVLTAVAAAAADHPQLSIHEAGDASIMKATSDKTTKDFKKAEGLSLPITLFVLLFAFGALVAALLPVALAMTAVFAATGLLAFASHLNPIDNSAGSVLLLVGLAVGVDYSMFYVKREREERAKGASKEAALRAAAATSGHSVLISGITVLIAMAGMFMAGDKVFAGIAWGSMLVVALAIIGSLTVLPALLSLLGDRVERGRIPGLSRLRRRNGSDGRTWGWILDKVLARPVASAVISGGALLALAIPVLGMHTAAPTISDLPQNLPVVQTYNQIETAFPGGPVPAMVVVQAHDVTSPAVQSGIASMERTALATGQMNQPFTTRVSPDRTVEVVSMPLAGDGENTASNRALHALRDKVIPETIGHVPGTTVNVGGLTAANQDWNSSLHKAIPMVFGFVLLLAFVLLLVSFRSIVIAAKAIVLNLLSVGASYGVLVWIFQEGHGQGLLGFHSTHAITSWLPIFMFVLLFGLSMDYHVFILNRIREGHLAGHSTGQAVSDGIKSSASTVTAAAVVMVMVFLTFATLSQVSMKEAGIGLATAVLLDATIVRTLLLPASMKLLGKWNWYLPSWLNWIPQIGHEPKAVADDTQKRPHRPTADTPPVFQTVAYAELATESAA
ncbi:MAG TPA: MMPL family transporter [Acidimicrobiales bacterium]